MNIIDEAAIAPRVALVYKADERNSFRVSYSRSTTGPSALESFIDLISTLFWRARCLVVVTLYSYF